MRGNEHDGSDAVKARGVTFPIPMRGNEKDHPVVAWVGFVVPNPHEG